MLPDLNLVLNLEKSEFKKVKSIKGQSAQYLFKTRWRLIAVKLINILMVHNQDIEDGMAWFGTMTL